MRLLVLGVALLLTEVYAQRIAYDHPVLAYSVLKNVPPSDDTEREFILNLNDDDGLLVVENNNRCDGDRFQTCIQQYADDLDLDEIPKDSLAFVRALKNIVEEEGLEGLKKECRAGTNLKRCLGNQYDLCVNEDYLKSIGVQEADAKVFITLSVQMTYQCTGGLDALIRNWDCISRVESTHRRDFERCQSDYARKVQQDPSNICRYTQEMVNCMTGPFKQSCPPAAYGVICHSLQIGIATSLPQCSIVCTKGSKDIKMRGEGRADTLSTFLARVLIENIPTHQFQAFRRRSLTTATCDDARFKRCLNKFVKDIGLSTMPKRAAALASYLNQLIAARKTAGFEQVCTAARNLGTCLGDQMEACFTAQHLEDMGLSPLDVLIYRELQAALASECGPGYDAIHDNVECMLNCAERHQSDFVQCASDFQRSIQRDPSHACGYAQTFLRCNVGLFKQTCGADLGAALCNAMRAEITVMLPNCKNLTCLSQEDHELIDSVGLLSGRPGTYVLDVLSDALPASMLRQQQATPTQDDDDDDDDSDEQDNDEQEAIEDPQAKCNDKKFGQCLKGYAQQLGLKSFPADPAEYGKALQTIVEKYGKIGFKKICMSGAKLGRCLGRQQVGACINVEHLMQLGLTKAQADGYIMITRILAFECTKGFRAIYNNWDCIINVQKRYNDTLIKCGQDFEKKAKQDPKNICKYAQVFVGCESKPYAEKCRRQVGTTICQLFQVVFKQALPKCPIKCSQEVDEGRDEIPAALLVPAREVQVPTDEIDPVED